MITVCDDRGNPREFNAAAVKIYTADDDAELLHPGNGQPANLGIDGPSDGEESDDQHQSNYNEDDPSDPDYAYDPTDAEFYCGYDSDGEHYVYLTEVLPIGDVRGRTRRFDTARAKEVEGLEAMGTWQIVNAADIPPEANVLVTGSPFH